MTYRGEVDDSMYSSSFGSLYIKFTSDDSYVDYGFWAEYRIGKTHYTLSQQTPFLKLHAFLKATTRSKNCTMELPVTTDVQEISAPGWPNLYENNLLCSWTMVAPDHMSVEINFTEFNTERCCDFVLVSHHSVLIWCRQRH